MFTMSGGSALLRLVTGGVSLSLSTSMRHTLSPRYCSGTEPEEYSSENFTWATTFTSFVVPTVSISFRSATAAGDRLLLAIMYTMKVHSASGVVSAVQRPAVHVVLSGQVTAQSVVDGWQRKPPPVAGKQARPRVSHSSVVITPP